MCGWPFANHLRLPSLVAAVRGDGFFCVPCSAGGAAVEMVNNSLFELVVFFFDFSFFDPVFCFFTPTFLFFVFGSRF